MMGISRRSSLSAVSSFADRASNASANATSSRHSSSNGNGRRPRGVSRAVFVGVPVFILLALSAFGENGSRRARASSSDEGRRVKTSRGRERGRGATTRAGGGGANFERLVKQNRWLFPQPELDEEQEALDAFWLSRGVVEEHQRASLVAMGHELASGVAERELYRNADALGHALSRLETLFPRGTDVAKMLWHCPEVLQLPLSEVAARLIAFKRAFPKVNAERVVEGNPRALLLDDLESVADALRELQDEFPQVDMISVIDFEPHVIQQPLPTRVRALRNIKPGDRSASLRAFYPPPPDALDPQPPMKNAQLFAKVFLLTTDCCFPRGDV